VAVAAGEQPVHQVGAALEQRLVLGQGLSAEHRPRAGHGQQHRKRVFMVPLHPETLEDF
jgi:hypothetical protein